MMNFGYYPYGFGFFGPILMILWWAFVIYAIVVFLRWLADSGRGHHKHRGNNALNLLKERYAKGEIEKKEFEEKKADLSKD